MKKQSMKLNMGQRFQKNSVNRSSFMNNIPLKVRRTSNINNEYSKKDLKKDKEEWKNKIEKYK